MTPHEQSESIAAFAKAWPKAQADMGAVLKDKTNPAFRSKYADLGAVIDAVLPALNKHGFGLHQQVGFEHDTKCVTCRTEIMHETGEWKAATLAVPVTKVDAQGLGSALTYARRYSLQAVTGVAPEDDDANAAIGQQTGAAAPLSVVPKTRAKAREDGDYQALVKDMVANQTSERLLAWGGDDQTKARIALLPSNWQAEFREEFGYKLADLRGEEQAVRESEAMGVPA